MKDRQEVKVLYWYKWDGGFWFRVFGYGLTISNRDAHKPPFSVRMGIRRELRIGKYGIGWLGK